MGLFGVKGSQFRIFKNFRLDRRVGRLQCVRLLPIAPRLKPLTLNRHRPPAETHIAGGILKCEGELLKCGKAALYLASVSGCYGRLKDGGAVGVSEFWIQKR